MGSASVLAQDAPDLLHVPSPTWEDQIIYFVMTDRFNDGDPTNNQQGVAEFEQGDDRKYQGGDFAGILEQLDYIQGLGATCSMDYATRCQQLVGRRNSIRWVSRLLGTRLHGGG
ncbi:MAG UNVERIFIED_CONTAM: hypothetical protein LVT10_09240 [Anaerolineae bacterium]